MKVTNLLLAAMLTVSTAAFAQTAVITAKAVESVLAKTTPQVAAQIGKLAKMQAGQSNSAIALGVAALLNSRSTDSQVVQLAKAIQSNKASVSDLQLVVAAMASQPIDPKKSDADTRSSQGVQLGERTDNRDNVDSVNQEGSRDSNSAPRVCTTKEDPTSILEAGCDKVNSPVAITNYEAIKADMARQNGGTLAGTLNNVEASSAKLVTSIQRVLKQSCTQAIQTAQNLYDSSCALVKAFKAPATCAVAGR